MHTLNIYLAGKVEGNKWKVSPLKDSRFKFIASDGSNHSEHNTGLSLYDFNECNNKEGDYAELVQKDFIGNLKKCHILLAYLDTNDSYGSIAEISYASAIGIPCHVIVKRSSPREDSELLQTNDPDGMFDAYYFVCSFPNVTVNEVTSQEDGMKLVHSIVSREYGKRFVNSVKFLLD